MNAAHAEPPFDHIVFDCDSTLCAIEGIDELARDHKVAVAALTDRAMAGELALQDVYAQRLDAFHCQFAFDLAGDGFDKFLGHDQLATQFLVVDDRIFQFRMNGRELVAGQCPGRGGPDQQVGVGFVAGFIQQGKADIHAGVGHFAVALADLARG